VKQLSLIFIGLLIFLAPSLSSAEDEDLLVVLDVQERKVEANGEYMKGLTVLQALDGTDKIAILGGSLDEIHKFVFEIPREEFLTAMKKVVDYSVLNMTEPNAHNYKEIYTFEGDNFLEPGSPYPQLFSIRWHDDHGVLRYKELNTDRTIRRLVDVHIQQGYTLTNALVDKELYKRAKAAALKERELEKRP